MRIINTLITVRNHAMKQTGVKYLKCWEKETKIKNNKHTNLKLYTP